MTLREYLRNLFSRKDNDGALWDPGHRQWNVERLPAGVALDTVATEPVALFAVSGRHAMLEGTAGDDGKVTYALAGWDEAGAERLKAYIREHGMDGVTVSRIDIKEWEASGENIGDLVDIAQNCAPSRTVRVRHRYEDRESYVVGGCASMEEAQKALSVYLEQGMPGLDKGVGVERYSNTGRATFTSDFLTTDCDAGTVRLPDELEVGEWFVTAVKKSEYVSDVTVDVGPHESFRDIEARAHETVRHGAVDKDHLLGTGSGIDGKYDDQVPRYIIVDERKHQFISMGAAMSAVAHRAVSRTTPLPPLPAAPETFRLLGEYDQPHYGVGSMRYRHTMPMAKALQYMELSEDGERLVDAVAHKLSPGGVSDAAMREIRAAVCLTDQLFDGAQDVTVHLERNTCRRDEYVEGCPLGECAAKLAKDPSLADDDGRLRTWLADVAKVRRLDIRFDTKNDRIILDCDIAGDDGTSMTLRRELPLDGDSRRTLHDNWGLSAAAPSVEVKELLMKTAPEHFLSYRGDGHREERDGAVKAFAAVLADKGREQYVASLDWRLYVDDPVVGCADRTLADSRRCDVVRGNVARLLNTGVSVRECRTLHEKGYAREKKTEKKAAGMKI